MNFGQYIAKKRDEKGWTQSDLVEALSTNDNTFSALNCVSVSRWESGQNEPSDDRKKIIINFFNDDVSLYFPFLPSANDKLQLKTTCNIIAYVLSDKISERRHNMLIGANPYPYNYKDCQVLPLSAKINDNYLKMILDFYYATHIATTKIGLEQLKNIAKKSIGVNYICEVNKIYFGHFIAILLKNNSFWAIMNGDMNESAIKESDFADNDDKNATLYIYSFYCGNKTISSVMFLKFYQFIVARKATIKYIGSSLVSKEGVNLMERIGLCEFKGHNVDNINNVVLKNGLEVASVSYLSKTSDLLTSKDMSYFSA